MWDVAQYIGVVMFSNRTSITIPPMVSIFTKGIGWVQEDIIGGLPASSSPSAGSRVVYFPIFLPSPCIVKRVWWANGFSTSGGASIDCGIYTDVDSAPGSKIVSGSATQGTVNEIQFVDVTDTALTPGMYWIAIVVSTNNSTTLFLGGSQNVVDAGRMMVQTSTYPLPSTATPVETLNDNYWLCGFSTISGTTDVSTVPSNMSYSSFSLGNDMTVPPMVSLLTKGIGWIAEDYFTSLPGSGAVNAVIGYWPIAISTPCVVKRVWWVNGASVTGGATIEVGIYADSGSYFPGTKLVSGSATQGTANQVQFVDVTDITLGQGLYWIGLATDETSNTSIFNAATGGYINANFRMDENGTSLPTTATPVEPVSTGFFLCGFSTTSGPS